MNKMQLKEWKKEHNPFRPNIEEGTPEERKAWEMGVDALFSEIKREENDVTSFQKDIMNRLKELHLHHKKMFDIVLDKFIELAIEELENEK